MVDETLDVGSWENDQRRLDTYTIGGIEVSGAEVRAVNVIWAFVHGLVVLEMQNHFAWAISEAESFFRGEVERWLEQLAPG